MRPSPIACTCDACVLDVCPCYACMSRLREEWRHAEARKYRGSFSAWERVLLLAVAATALFLLSGCGMPYECVTRGGLRVANDATCDDGLDAIQARIEYEAALLGFKPHLLEHARLFEVTQNLDAYGAFLNGTAPVRGLTDCSMATLSVSRWNGEPWTSTALAHEAFHLAQGCVYDTSVLDSCRAAGGTAGEDGPAIEFRCDQEAQHPGWAVSIYPAIARIDAGGAL